MFLKTLNLKCVSKTDNHVRLKAFQNIVQRNNIFHDQHSYLFSGSSYVRYLFFILSFNILNAGENQPFFKNKQKI